MLSEIFSSYFVWKKNYLTEMDTRVKLFFVLGTIIIILFSQHPLVPLCAFLLSLVFLLSIGVSAKIIILRLSAPLTVAIMIMFIQTLFYGTTTILKCSFLGFHLIGYKEGLWRGLLIFSKVTGAVSMLIFLSMTTPVNKLLNLARRLKIPKVWVEIALLSYRYIFVLAEEAITIRDAQKMRLGYNKLTTSLRSLGKLAGAVAIRAYDQSISTHEAMVLRGYKGEMPDLTCPEKFKYKDAIASGIVIVIFALLIFLNILW